MDKNLTNLQLCIGMTCKWVQRHKSRMPLSASVKDSITIMALLRPT
jgi:hypothetical protein